MDKIEDNIELPDGTVLVYYIPMELMHIGSEVKESKYFLEFDEDWDEEGAESIKVESYKEALDFLYFYANILFEQNFILFRPCIDILRDGKIYIEFMETKKQNEIKEFQPDEKELLIIFDEKNNQIHKGNFWNKDKDYHIKFEFGKQNFYQDEFFQILKDYFSYYIEFD